MSIKLSTDEIRTVAIFEQITGVGVKDCILNGEDAYFLIEPNKTGLVIGKNGMIIKTVRNMLGKNIKVFEYADTLEGMIRNMIPSAKNIVLNGDSVTVSVDAKDRSMVIGKGGKNIKIIKEFLYRHFKIRNLRLR